MRVLEFLVDKQNIRRKPGCDFSKIVAGSVGYLHAKFYFSEEWDGCKKAVSFYLGETEKAKMLDQNDSCEIPHEILTGNKFEVSVTGVKAGYKLKTNKYTVKQEVN